MAWVKIGQDGDACHGGAVSSQRSMPIWHIPMGLMVMGVTVAGVMVMVGMMGGKGSKGKGKKGKDQGKGKDI